jgi:hypothetical protein
MKNVFKVALSTSILAFSMSASAAVLTFDDLTAAIGYGPVGPSYAGYTFKNWAFINSPPYPYPTASGTTIVFNTAGSSAEILFGKSVDVDSLFIADFSTNNDVKMMGYANGELKYSAAYAPIAGAMTKYFTNFDGIDRLVFNFPFASSAFFDSIEVNPSNPVPEPVSALLIAVGGLALTLSRRRAFHAL